MRRSEGFKSANKVIGSSNQRRHLGEGEAVAPKEKEKRKKERKKEKIRKKREKREKRKKGTMNSVKLLHVKCCFFQFFNSPAALKNIKKICPQEKVEMTPLALTGKLH